MFEWISEIEEPILGSKEVNGELRLKRIESKEDLFRINEICQLFASFDVILNENALTSFPTPNQKAKSIIMNDVVPHYVDVKQIFIDGKLKEINVRGLKEKSKKMIEDLLLNGIYPVVPDLFRSKSLEMRSYPKTLKYYTINKQYINELYIKETEDLFDFLNCSFFAENGSIMLQPTGWTLEDNLKESVTIRTFSSFAKQVVLVVNVSDKSVVGVDIYG